MLPARESVKTLIVGGRGGIGSAFARLLNPATTVVTGRAPFDTPAKGGFVKLDLSNPEDFPKLTQELKGMGFHPDLILNCTGVLALPGGEEGKIIRPEAGLKKITPELLRKTFETNTFANALLMKELVSGLIPNGKHPFLFASWSARVGSLEANELGGWYSYRASKAAQNMFVKTASIELKRSHPNACLLMVHPGTCATELSEPFVGSAKRKTLQSEDPPEGTPLSGYFTPEFGAELMWKNVLSSATPEDTGKFLDYEGKEIPW
ncbi:unnamed protein product [Amoebophrya sp. A25]|nr:unnamed protein product [Amoebophrya sp. A25]|eukprot:GSA25T00004552001.1